MEIKTGKELEANFEELHVLEAEFEDAELEIIRKAEAIQKPIYKRREGLIKKIPHFWSLVFEQAPLEVDNFIQPSDSKLFAECFDTFEVCRFELDDAEGSPRSFALRFGFKENEYFEDQILEKKFWYRRTAEWAGLVSEPVKINWKKGKDTTAGLTDAAYLVGEERRKLAAHTYDREARKKERKSKVYKDLAQKIATSHESSVSFFGLFSFVSGYRWVSAEESAQVAKEEKEKLEKMKQGEKVAEDEDENDEEDGIDYQEVEVFPNGDELATVIAEDMWPNALKYYKATFDEDGDDDDASLDSNMMEDSENEEGEGDSGEEQVDMDELVGRERPNKKQRKE